MKILVSKCCNSIPWNDTDVCAECKENADFILYNEKEFYKYTPKMPLGIEAKRFIVEALEYYIDRWGTTIDYEELSEDSVIELNRITLDANKYYLKTIGHKKHKYPTINHKDFHKSGDINESKNT